MNMLWSPNPRRKRRKMSAKQAKFFGKRKHRRSSRARRRSSVIASAPVAQFVARRRRRARRAVGRISRRRRSGGGGFRTSGIVGLLKAGAIGGAGGVLVDVAMSQVRGFLPASMQSPTDANNNPNYGYYAAKFGLVLALNSFGRRLPVIGRYAPEMATGATSILAYQFMRPMVPSSMLAAYFNPAPTMRPASLSGARMGAYVSPAVGVRATQSLGRGSRAAGVLNMVNTSRQAA